jgi:hypothetical protein
MSDTLTPQYLDIDFATLKDQLKTQLSESTIFRDYDYEGANITILIELVSYLGALTTYYINKVAQNQYIDTADIYETVHMLARLRGYNPKGYISAQTSLTISIGASAGASAGDEIYIPAWTELYCSAASDSDGNPIKYTIVSDVTETIPVTASFPYVLTSTIPCRQGEVVEYSYTGDDLVDNILYLPFINFDYDDNIDETDYPSIQVKVENAIWTRISDFYDELSALSTVDDVYMFRYDKYQKYLVEFSSSRNTPGASDTIDLTLLKSIGTDGTVAASSIDTFSETNSVYNRTTLAYLTNTYITITNATATTGAASPETIDEVKNASLGVMHSQYRNVTSLDYVSHLEERPDVVAANVWGEQDVVPSGSTLEYNKVHIAVIPDEWGTGTILTSAASAGIEVPYEYAATYKTTLSTWLEPRKILTVYEQYDLPDLVYFAFDIGIKVKRTYTYSTVMNDVRSKLTYYFNSANRSFGETVSHLDITNYILDSTITSTAGESWDQVKGVQNLIFRNIDVLTHTVYEPNSDGNYPQYSVVESTYPDENKLRHIVLGDEQFPVLAADYCSFSEET